MLIYLCYNIIITNNDKQKRIEYDSLGQKKIDKDKLWAHKLRDHLKILKQE